MKQCVNEQMATCKHTEELAVDHMCDPREWMPVSDVKSRERPGESIERHAAVDHGVFRDIRRVIEMDEAMSDQLRINPKCHNRQTEQDDKVGALQPYDVADLESSLLAKTFGVRTSFVRCSNTDSFFLLRCPFSHVFCESWLGTPSLSSLPSVGFSASQREFFTEGSEENKGWNWVCNPSSLFASFCLIFW